MRGMNHRSSRAHTIVRVRVEKKNKEGAVIILRKQFVFRTFSQSKGYRTITQIIGEQAVTCVPVVVCHRLSTQMSSGVCREVTGASLHIVDLAGRENERSILESDKFGTEKNF